VLRFPRRYWLVTAPRLCGSRMLRKPRIDQEGSTLEEKEMWDKLEKRARDDGGGGGEEGGNEPHPAPYIYQKRPASCGSMLWFLLLLRA
jgi:hypothetical protein